MVHIVHMNQYGEQVTRCDELYSPKMAAIKWEKPLDACGLLSVLDNVCTKCAEGVPIR